MDSNDSTLDRTEMREKSQTLADDISFKKRQSMRRHEGTMPLHSSLELESGRPVSQYIADQNNPDRQVSNSTSNLTSGSPLQTTKSLFSGRIQLNILAVSHVSDHECKLALFNQFAKRKFNRSNIQTSYQGLNFARLSYTSPNGEVCDVKVYETSIDMRKAAKQQSVLPRQQIRNMDGVIIVYDERRKDADSQAEAWRDCQVAADLNLYMLPPISVVGH